MNLLKKLQLKVENSFKPITHDDSVLKQPKHWMRAITWGLISTGTFGITWLAVAQTEEIVVARGILEPIGSVKEIQMPLGGITDEILVKDGDRVKKGQILIRLDSSKTQRELEALSEVVKSKNDQLDLKREEMNKYLEMNTEEIKMLESSLLLSKNILSKYKYLANEGAAAATPIS